MGRGVPVVHLAGLAFVAVTLAFAPGLPVPLPAPFVPAHEPRAADITRYTHVCRQIAQHQRGWPHDLLQASRPVSYATQDKMCRGKVRTGSELLRDNLIYSRGIPLSVD